MVDVARHALVRRSAADCFEVLVDLERIPRWQRGSGIRRVIVRGDDPVSLGTAFRLESRFSGWRRVWLDVVVSAFDPPCRFGYRSAGGRSFDLVVDFALTPAADATLVDSRITVAIPAALRPLAPLIGRELGHRIAADLAHFQRLLESGVDPAR